MCLPVTLCNKGVLALDDDKSRFMWDIRCEGGVLPRGFPSQRRTSTAITMMLATEMEHMGVNHVVIYAADVEPPPSCSAPQWDQLSTQKVVDRQAVCINSFQGL